MMLWNGYPKNMMTQIDHEAKSFHLPIRYILIPYIYNCPIVSHIIPYLYTFIKPVVSHHFIYHPINEQLRIGGVKPSQAYQSMGVVFPVLSYHHSSHLSGSKSMIQKIFCAIIPSPLHHGSRLLIIVYNYPICIIPPSLNISQIPENIEHSPSFIRDHIVVSDHVRFQLPSGNLSYMAIENGQ